MTKRPHEAQPGLLTKRSHETAKMRVPPGSPSSEADLNISPTPEDAWLPARSAYSSERRTIIDCRLKIADLRLNKTEKAKETMEVKGAFLFYALPS